MDEWLGVYSSVVGISILFGFFYKDTNIMKLSLWSSAFVIYFKLVPERIVNGYFDAFVLIQVGWMFIFIFPACLSLIFLFKKLFSFLNEKTIIVPSYIVVIVSLPLMFEPIIRIYDAVVSNILD